jgi:hypothetical protein
MSLLTKFADRIATKDTGVETVSITVQDIYVVSKGTSSNGYEWTKLGIRSDKGTFYCFENALSGIKANEFIGDAGRPAKITIREQSYKDSEGVDQESIEVMSLKVSSTNTDMLAEMAKLGLVVRI